MAAKLSIRLIAFESWTRTVHARSQIKALSI
jgi:hypothetical protein